MSLIERRLHGLGIVLPQPLRMPPGVVLPFPWVRVIGDAPLKYFAVHIFDKGKPLFDTAP